MRRIKNIVSLLLIFVFSAIGTLNVSAFADEKPLKSNFELKQNVDTNNCTVGDTLNINYDVNSLMNIDKKSYDAINSKNKEIVLVVDTSGSMNEREIEKVYKVKAANFDDDYWGLLYDGMYDYINYIKLEDNKEYYVYDLKKEVGKYININGRNYSKYIIKDNRRYYLQDTASGLCAICFGKSRIEQLQDAAKKFVERFKGKSNVKISLVSYGNKGKVVKTLTNNLDEIDKAIDNELIANGGTNIGDGIRIANGILNNGNSADKYMVLMTDGQPTAATCYNNVECGRYRYYDSTIGRYVYSFPNGEVIDGYGRELSGFNYINSCKYKFDYNPKNPNHNDENIIVNYGENDYGNLALNYSKEALKKSNKSGINNFVVGFSNGANTEKLKEISKAGNGYYREAMHGDELEDVYNRIADEINKPVIKDITFNFNLPDGLVIEDVIDSKTKNSIKDKLNVEISNHGKTIKFKLDNISYNEEKDENGNTKYVVSKDQLEKLKFSLKIKSVKSGEYVIGGTNKYGPIITYTDVDEVNKKKGFNEESFSIKDGKEALSVEKVGLFLGKDNIKDLKNFKDLYNNVSLINGFRYQIGTVIDIGDGQKADKLIKNDGILKSSILGVEIIGKPNYKLYYIEGSKLQLVERIKNTKDNNIEIPKNTLKKNGKYILVQDIIINDNTNKKYNLESDINLQDYKDKGTMKVRLIDCLPDLD